MNFHFCGKACLILFQIIVITTLVPELSWAKSTQVFDITKEPNEKSWQEFFETSEQIRQKLWNSKKKQGFQLKDWSWQWRLAWVRACSISQQLYCGQILADALKDSALVVRSESASLIGRRFAGSANPLALQLLKDAYHDQRNYREGRPMFVQYRILAAIHAIDPGNASLLHSLSKNSQETRHFATKLKRSNF